MKTLVARIANLLLAVWSPELAYAWQFKPLIERTLKLKIQQILRLEIESPRSLVVFFSDGAGVSSKVFTGSTYQILATVNWTRILKPGIRVSRGVKVCRGHASSAPRSSAPQLDLHST